MFLRIILCTLVVYTIGRPQDANEVDPRLLQANAKQPQYDPKSSIGATIINQTEESNADGSFNFSFETSDGVRVQQNGFLKKSETQSTNPEEGDGFVQVLTGGYSYTAPNGEVIQLQYIADENGFQPQGSHIPTAPPVPENIARSLEQINNTPQHNQGANVQNPPQQPPQVVSQAVTQRNVGQTA